jgi:flagellar biosynthesis protein FliR
MGLDVDEGRAVMILLNFPLEQVQTFLFVLVRTAAVLFSVPFLDSKNVPIMVKAGLAVAVTLLIVPHLPSGPPDLLDRPVHLIMGLAVEVVVGLMIGLIVQLFFTGIQLAGQTIGYQMGFAIANVVDPASSLQIPLLSQFYNLFAMMLFLALDVHVYFIKTLAEMFQHIPLWSFRLDQDLFALIMMLTANAFIMAVKIGAPVMVALLLTNAALGLVARTVPQMQIFVVAMPLKILLGLFFMGISLPFCGSFLREAFIVLGKTIQSLTGWLS